MDRDEIIAEISMRRDIPMEEVEEVLDEEDLLFAEYESKRKRKKRRFFLFTFLVFIAGAVAAVFYLDRQQKIDVALIKDTVEENVKKYADKIWNHERA
ncbi:MAG: hypothetical protein IKO61_08070 [Lachnospiraceae bacterium]|nr:hypothetical protein [Lachnospiraceae bacterium]